MINPGDSNFVSEFSMESGGNVVSDDAPFHVLVLGDWRGAAERSGGIESRKPFEIDRDEFDDVMRRLRPRAELFFGDANVLSIEFNEIDDFHPDRLFGRLSVFESLRQVREELRDPRSFDHAAREVRSWFSADTEVVAAYERKKKDAGQAKRQALPDHLPREERLYDITDAEKTCACCGGEKTCFGKDISEQLKVIPPQVVVVSHQRLKSSASLCS